MSRVSKRYAKAWFGLSLESGTLDKSANDVDMLKDMYATNNEFHAFVLNPLVRPGKRKELIESLFKNKVDTLTFDFLNLLSSKKRLNVLEDVLIQFDELLREHKNQVAATIVSAAKLDDDQLQAIRKSIEQMSGKSALIETDLDESLLGGFLIKIEDRIIDNSIRNQLQKLREQLVS